MGNQQASQTNLSLTSQEREDWVKVEDQGYCELWANKKTNRRFQAYAISEATARDNVQIEKYAFRKIHNAYLVSAEAVISQNQSFLCSEPVTSFVLIQNIVGRLRSYARALSFEEALYVLSSAATGYNTICSFFGPLEPNEDLVCFNDEGHVKVWLNENLSKNEASTNARSSELEPTSNEDYSLAKRRSRACVEKLLKIVEISSQQGYPPAFQEETKNLSTFFEISNFVDYFCEKNNIHIPDRIRLNRTIMNAPLQSTNMINLPTRSLHIQSQSQSQLQSISSLQSSRVNRVFQSNHQREGLIPIVSTAPVIQFGSSVPFRYPVQQVVQPPQVTWVQSNSISYGYAPIIQQKPVIISVPPSQNVVVSLPVQVQEPVQVITNVVQEPERVVIQMQQQQQVHGNFQEIPQSQSNDHIESNHEDFNEPSHFQEQIVEPKIDYHYAQQPQQEQIVIQQQQKVEERIPYENQEEWHEEEQHHGLHQNIQHIQQYVSQQIHQHQHQEPKERIASSIYSNIQQYVAPPPQHQTIIEVKQEEQIASPEKKSLEIEDWEQRLTQFTKSNQKSQNNTVVIVPVQNKQPESFKNLIVSEQKEEYVNELADLQTDDIEKYIRMKYQSYLNEKSEPIAQNYNAEPEQNYYTKAEQYKPASYLYSDDNTYTSNYVSNAFRTSNPYNEEEIAQEVVQKTYYQPFEYKSQEKWHIEPKQKENMPASYRYDLPSDNKASIDQELQYNLSRRNQLNNYGVKYESQLDEINMEQYYPANVSRRTSERSKGNRNSNLIDEKYSKYVLNSQKPKRPTLNINSQDVSLILPVDESHLTKYSARPIIEKSIEHESFSYNKPSEKKGITYEKLRNLLWEQ